MNNSPVFCALIEIQPLKGCELSPKKVAGATVRCFIPAVNAEKAMELLKLELEEMKMKLVETEWCVDYENTEWENPENESQDDLVQEARSIDGIVFETFLTWGHDAKEND